jgi:hypothetical protein
MKAPSPTTKDTSKMNALLSRVLETFTSLQGKRNAVKSTRITVTAVEHERHDLHTQATV